MISDPSIRIAYIIGDVSISKIKLTPLAIAKESPSIGGRPGAHVSGSDQYLPYVYAIP